MNGFAWSLIESTGAFRAARRLTRSRVIAVTYHHVLPDESRTPGPRPNNVAYVSEFVQQIEYLSRHFHIMRPDELRRFLDGKPTAPHSVLITFDDGYRNNYSHAFPVLQRAGAAALFFVASGFVGDRRNRLWFDRLDAAFAAQPDKAAAWLQAAHPCARLTPASLRSTLKRLPAPERDAIVADIEDATGHRNAEGFEKSRVEPMTWDEVRAMARGGMHIGAHTETHQILSAATDQQVYRELRRCRIAIESQLGCPCWAFSYPNGERTDFGAREFEALRDAGFLCAFSQVPGTIAASSFAYSLPRIPLPSAGELPVFQSRVSGLHQFLTSPRLAWS